jgi:hypothetical protein
MVVLLLAACSEYQVNPDEKDPGAFDTAVDTAPPVDLQPELSVDPVAVAEAAVCGERDVPVTLTNSGDAELTITGLALDGAATGSLPATPFPIAAGGSVTITVTVSPGDGSLTIDSDDPSDPVVTVPLSATADEAPSLAILAPTSDSVIDVGAALELSAQVSDDADDPSDVAVAWSSDVDGAIASSVPDHSGLALATWDAGARSAGPQSLTATATDSCGNVTTQTVTFCQQAGYDEDNIDLSTWHFEGVATWDTTNDWLQLTPPTNNQVGSAFQTGAAVTGDSVSIELQFYIGGGTGADGLALTALDIDRMTGFLASAGGCLGYGQDAGCPVGNPPLPGWTIEIDTYQNAEWDPTAQDHVSFAFDGSMRDIEAWAPLPEMEDTGWHTFSATVTAPHVTVVIDGVTYIDQDIPGYYAFPAYVGFSAATGGDTNYHLIDALLVTEYACPTD